MPCKCCVPFCNGNTPNGPKVSVFSFPRNEELKQKWLLAIQRKDYYPTKHSRVCILHFEESDLKREASACDPKTGRTITAPLGIIRLKKDAVPSLFNVCDLNNKSRKKKDQGDVGNGKFSHRLQQNIASTELENSHLTDTLKSNMSLESKNTVNQKKKLGRKKRKRQSEGTTTDEVGDSSVICCQNNNQEALSYHLDEKNHCISKCSQVLPAVNIKVEKPWEEECNYAEKPSVEKSDDCDKLQIEIKDVRSVSSSFSKKISESPSIFARPLQILKREEIFGKFVASELSDLCKNPELYLKTKQAILDILIQAQFEQIKHSSTVL